MINCLDLLKLKINEMKNTPTQGTPVSKELQETIDNFMKWTKYPCHEAVETIRDIQKSYGFKSFRINKKSSPEEIKNVLGFLLTMITELNEHSKPKLDILYSKFEEE